MFDKTYEAPAITAVTDVTEPLIGFIGSSVGNPQWNDEADES